MSGSAPAPAVGSRSVWSGTAVAWFVALLGWTAVVSFYGLEGGADFEPTDAWVGQTAREMRESDDWRGYMIPRFSGETRMQKSPGAYWAVILTSLLRGTPVDEVAVRIPSALSAVLFIAAIYWLALHIAGTRAAVFSGFVTASSAGLLTWSHRGASDLGVTALMTVSLAALWIALERAESRRGRFWLIQLGYLAAGLAMLYKQPMPLACVGIPAVLYVLCFRRWDVFRDPAHLLGILIFAACYLPWFLTTILIQPRAVIPGAEQTSILTILQKWRVEYWDRLTGALPNVEGQRFDWKIYLLYPAVAFAFSVPFCLSIPGAVARAFRQNEGVHRREQSFLLIWFLGLFVFFMLAAGKETRYFLPVMPPLYILLGIEVARFFDPGRRETPSVDRVMAGCVLMLVPIGMAGAVYGYYKLHAKLGAFAEYDWAEVAPPLITTLALFWLGAAVSACLYAARREHGSFAALVLTMFAAWFYAWPRLMPVLGNERPAIDFARQLRDRLPREHRGRIRQVAQQDSRIIWYSDVRFPRVIDQLKLLEMLGGKRDQMRERELIAREMVRLCEQPELALFASDLENYLLFTEGARMILERQGRTPPPTYLWLAGSVGRPDHRTYLFGNKPPPWGEPTLDLPDGAREKARSRIQREFAKLLDEAERLRGGPGSGPAAAPASGASGSRPASRPAEPPTER